MSTLRALFLARPAREKFLILALLVAVVVIWGSNLLGRAQAFASEAKSTSTELKDQALWISRKDRIEKYAEQEAANLDQSQTLDALRLTSTVQNLVQEAGLTQINISPSQDTSAGNFAFHTIMLSVQRASWDQIVKLCGELQDRAPYIGIDNFSLLASPPGSDSLNANLNISSVEIVRTPE